MKEVKRSYWKSNLKIVFFLMSIWALASFGFGIFLAPWLDKYNLPFTEYPLGFWFAQQGSIYIFVIIIIVYVKLMNRLDSKYELKED